MKTGDKFPLDSNKSRLNQYDKFGKLLSSDHIGAFGQHSKDFSKDYGFLRYVTCNFAGLVAKVSADFLFGEEVTIKVKEKANSEWLNALWFDNKMKTQNYESALSNSARGDAVYRIRVEDNKIKIEDVNPAIYFPVLESDNFRQKPSIQNLAWVDTHFVDGKELKFAIIEQHKAGEITTMIWELRNDELGASIDVNEYNKLYNTGYIPFLETGIDESLIVHIPNYRDSFSFWGASDFVDIESLNFALNNRMTKTDNILDKHGDPILALPPGILDENGRVDQKSLGLIELPEGTDAKPEYIVWNANLDSAFKQIDKIVEFMFMFSETSPDVMGLGKSGQAESGRALKMRLLRTIAKRNRKRLYYDQGLKEILEIAQKLAVKHGYEVDGKKITKVAEVDLFWSDGVVDDTTEIIEQETLQVESGLTSKKRAIMNINAVDEKMAENILEEINTEKADFSTFWQENIGNKTDKSGNVTDPNAPEVAKVAQNVDNSKDAQVKQQITNKIATNGKDKQSGRR